MSLQLSPAQQTAFDEAQTALATNSVVSVNTAEGLGRTTVLRALLGANGGVMFGAREILEATATAHPLQVEEQIHALTMRAMGSADHVFIDDFHLVAAAITMCQANPRSGYLSAVIASLATLADASAKHVVFGADGNTASRVIGKHDRITIPDFSAEDYRHIATAHLPGGDMKVDFERVFRHAPKLSARQLRRSCTELTARRQPITTELLLAHVDEHHLASNVRLGEVQDVELSDLRGMEDVLEALEAAVVFPIENAAATAEFALRPKRGVLLAGPPGTGKTTVGRALARRLKGKFFLLDGTTISGSRDFYDRVKRLFELAKRSAPAIIFIDDSDVIFENNQETGFYRYLLTMLDGLESESPGQICVMLTAMDVGNLPPALVRSGRIELWLETRLPDSAARAQIISDHVAKLPQSVGTVDIARVAEATEGLSGADLKRTVADGKLLFAYDQARGRTTQPITEYLLAALGTVLGNREQYAAAAARASALRPSRPPQFSGAAMEHMMSRKARPGAERG